MRDNTSQEPIIVSAMPDIIFAARRCGLFFVQPKRVQFRETTVGYVKHEFTLRLYHFWITVLRILFFVILFLEKKVIEIKLTKTQTFLQSCASTYFSLLNFFFVILNDNNIFFWFRFLILAIFHFIIMFRYSFIIFCIRFVLLLVCGLCFSIFLFLFRVLLFLFFLGIRFLLLFRTLRIFL